MFPEGQGKRNAKAKLKAISPKTNALYVNAKAAVDKFFKARGYDPRRPAYVKEKLGYALDQYEAIAYTTTRAMGYPLLSPEEAKTIGKRCNNLLTPLEKRLKEMRKRGARAAAERTALLAAPAALNLEMPKRKAPEPVEPAPAPPVPPAPSVDSPPPPAPAPAVASVPPRAWQLSHAQKLKRRRILNEWSNDACTCGVAPEHSMFCQIYRCYAYEVGCCDPDICPRMSCGEWEIGKPDQCICIEDVFHPPEWEDDCSHLRFRPWVDRYGRRPQFWDRESERYRSVGVSFGMRACTRCLDGCGLPGTYVSLCPFQLDAAGNPKDRRLVFDGGCWQRADGEDWEAPGCWNELERKCVVPDIDWTSTREVYM